MSSSSRKSRRGSAASPSSVVAPAQRNAGLEVMAKLAAKRSFRPAREVLTRVLAVPTIFPQFDGGTRVGGLPLQRYTVLHGESAHGKTIAALGFELSFLERGHFVLHVDAELTTPITWVEKLMGKVADHPNFYAMRTCIYERVSDGVRGFCEMVGEAREKGLIPKETGGLVVLDSWTKLVPDRVTKRLEKDGATKAGVDGYGGRLGQLQAAQNAQWLKEVVPLLYDTNCAMCGITREGENPDAGSNGPTFKIRGGKDVIYDSSMSIRTMRKGYVTLTGKSEDDEKEAIGERHLLRIWRSKVAGRDDKSTDVYFHTSNGKFVPEGFDRARDVLELARRMEIVTGEGWYSYGNQRLGQGENRAVKHLYEHPEQLAEIEARVRAGFVLEGAPAA